MWYKQSKNKHFQTYDYFSNINKKYKLSKLFYNVFFIVTMLKTCFYLIKKLSGRLFVVLNVWKQFPLLLVENSLVLSSCHPLNHSSQELFLALSGELRSKENQSQGIISFRTVAELLHMWIIKKLNNFMWQKEEESYK